MKQLAYSQVADKSIQADVADHDSALQQQQQQGHQVVDSHLVAAMKSVVGRFNDKTASAVSYDTFFKGQ